MDLEEYATYDGAGLAQLVKKREVTSKELAELMLEGVEEINPKVNAVIETYSAFPSLRSCSASCFIRINS
jgi:amidase